MTEHRSLPCGRCQATTPHTKRYPVDRSSAFVPVWKCDLCGSSPEPARWVALEDTLGELRAMVPRRAFPRLLLGCKECGLVLVVPKRNALHAVPFRFVEGAECPECAETSGAFPGHEPRLVELHETDLPAQEAAALRLAERGGKRHKARYRPPESPAWCDACSAWRRSVDADNPAGLPAPLGVCPNCESPLHLPPFRAVVAAVDDARRFLVLQSSQLEEDAERAELEYVRACSSGDAERLADPTYPDVPPDLAGAALRLLWVAVLLPTLELGLEPVQSSREPLSAGVRMFLESVSPDHVVVWRDGEPVTAGAALSEGDQFVSRYATRLIATAVAYLRGRQEREGVSDDDPVEDVYRMMRDRAEGAPLPEGACPRCRGTGELEEGRAPELAGCPSCLGTGDAEVCPKGCGFRMSDHGRYADVDGPQCPSVVAVMEGEPDVEG